MYCNFWKSHEFWNFHFRFSFINFNIRGISRSYNVFRSVFCQFTNFAVMLCRCAQWILFYVLWGSKFFKISNLKSDIRIRHFWYVLGLFDPFLIVHWVQKIHVWMNKVFFFQVFDHTIAQIICSSKHHFLTMKVRW